jgi:hypothetical protein
MAPPWLAEVILLIHTSKCWLFRMPTEQERPGMYAPSYKTTSKHQHGPANDKIGSPRQVHQVRRIANANKTRPATESSRSRSAAQQGHISRQEQRVNLQATEDSPVTTALPDLPAIPSYPLPPSSHFPPTELQSLHQRSTVSTTLQSPSRNVIRPGVATTTKRCISPRAVLPIEDYTDLEKLTHRGKFDQEMTAKVPTVVQQSAFQPLSLHLPPGPSLHGDIRRS